MVEEQAYSKRYALRRVYKDANYIETGVPFIVVEKEARKNAMTVDEFLKKFEVECLFNAFEGFRYKFVEKEAKGV